MPAERQSAIESASASFVTGDGGAGGVFVDDGFAVFCAGGAGAAAGLRRGGGGVSGGLPTFGVPVAVTTRAEDQEVTMFKRRRRKGVSVIAGGSHWLGHSHSYHLPEARSVQHVGAGEQPTHQTPKPLGETPMATHEKPMGNSRSGPSESIGLAVRLDAEVLSGYH